MKRLIGFSQAAVPAAVIVFTGCGGAKFVNTANLPDTYQCRHMNEICKEARSFEAEFNKMSKEEREDAENVLKAYRMQCNDALKRCEESAPEE